MLLKNVLAQIPGIDWQGDRNTEIKGSPMTRGPFRRETSLCDQRGEDGRSSLHPSGHQKRRCSGGFEHPVEPAVQVAAIAVRDARRFLAEISRAFYEDPSKKLKLAGITGTKGKTTTSYLMDSIFKQAKIAPALWNDWDEDRVQSYHSSHTTRNPPTS